MKKHILYISLFLMLALIAGCVHISFQPPGASEQVNNKNSKTNKTIFTYVGADAKSVYVAGDFNNWSADATPLTNKDGVWSVSLSLAEGTYGYKFVVDSKWMTDKHAPSFADDGYGGQNSQVIIGKKAAPAPVKQAGTRQGDIPLTFTYQPLIGGKADVFLAGDFNNWSADAAPMSESNGIYSVTLKLKKGKYAYKFVVNGQWMTDENAGSFADDGMGGQNSVAYAGDASDLNALRRVDFSFKPASTVKEVYLVGSMNDWNQKSDMMRIDTAGTYHISKLLKTATYSYKFLTDGMNWLPDPNAKNDEEDGYGGKNSVVIVNEDYPQVMIKKGDGQVLSYGLNTSQSLQSCNPLSATSIEFKARAHADDIDKMYLLMGSKEIPMQLVSNDGSYEYYKTIINLKNKDAVFDYAFVYVDGDTKSYLVSGKFADTPTDMFTYSPATVQPFFTPDWVKKGIIYQIFPDRFYNGDKSNDPDFSEWYYKGKNTPPAAGQKLAKDAVYYHLVDDWYDVAGLKSNPVHPEGKPDWWSFYGGDAVGIQEKLGYLADLGITIIYFNPIFQAKSNHRYDAVDYAKADPHFASETEMKALVAAAHKIGIKVILDVAYNHTGETFWAFQDGMKKGKDSPYYDWYEWKKWPLPTEGGWNPSDYYECWWGFGEMPNLNFDLSLSNPEENSITDIADANPNWEVVNYLNGLSDYWIGEVDFDGFRLDVPNEVPFWFWKLFRKHIKEIKPDAYLVGEIWSNAVDWVNDDYFDSVMNYAYFKDPVMRFFNARSCSAKTFDNDLKPGRLLYPTQSSQVMMNLIGSHDTHRYLQSAGGQYSRLKLAVLFGMTYVGAPHIWYGDEIGMMGEHDPDCRRPMEWNYVDEPVRVALRDYYKQLIAIRKNNAALSIGDFKTLHATGRAYAYERSYQGDKLFVVINNEEQTTNISLAVDTDKLQLTDLISMQTYQLMNGKVKLSINAMSGLILK